MNFLELFKDLENVEMVKLHRTIPQAIIEDDRLKENLFNMYNHTNKIYVRLATILNSAFYEKRLTFMMSKRILETLIKNDENSKFTSISSAEYKDLIFRLCSTNFLKRLREPTPGRAGIWKIVKPEIVDIMYRINSKEYFDAQEENALRLYDEFEVSKNRDILTPEEIDERIRNNTLRLKQ